jgi:O-acetylserine/cysteine efflux transporter
LDAALGSDDWHGRWRRPGDHDPGLASLRGRMSPRDIALATLPPALWAITYVIAKPATAHFPPMFLVGMVYALTAAILARPWHWRTPFLTLLTCATLGGAIQSAFIYTGIARVPASMTVLVVQTEVPLAVLAGWAIGQERLNFRRLFGIAVALAGVAVVVGIPTSWTTGWGIFFIILGTVSWGTAQGLIRSRSQEAGGQLMGAIALFSFPQLFVFSFFLEEGQIKTVTSAGWFEWGMVVALAIIGYVVPYTIWYGMLRRYRVDQVAPFVLLMPIIGVLAGAVFLGERLTPPALIGGAIIVTGLALVVGLPDRRRPAGP